MFTAEAVGLFYIIVLYVHVKGGAGGTWNLHCL